MKKYSLLFLFCCLLFAGCQRETKVLENAVTDVDNNSYPAAKIGKHIWMLQDLKTFRFADNTMMDDAHTQGAFDMLIAATLRHHQYPAYNKGSISYMKSTNTPNSTYTACFPQGTGWQWCRTEYRYKYRKRYYGQGIWYSH